METRIAGQTLKGNAQVVAFQRNRKHPCLQKLATAGKWQTVQPG
jgi:hypothetical protein